MPRSNKKKKTFHPAVPANDSAITDLLNIEKSTMIARAIVSRVFFSLSFFQSITYRQVLRDTESTCGMEQQIQELGTVPLSQSFKT